MKIAHFTWFDKILDWMKWETKTSKNPIKSWNGESVQIVVLFKAQSKFSLTDEVKINSHSPAQSRGQAGTSDQEN